MAGARVARRRVRRSRVSRRGASARPRRAPPHAGRGPRPVSASAAEKGLLKILSKMGISTLSSYCGAQIFEVLGLGHEVIGTCFAGTASPRRHRLRGDRRGRARPASRGVRPADAEPVSLPDHGRVRFRKDGEDHGWAPPVVVALQQAVKTTAPGRLRRVPGQARRSRRPAGPRDLLAVRRARPSRSRRSSPPTPSAPRFVSSAMSPARSRRRRTPRSRSR